jgi:hypothetical protein
VDEIKEKGSKKRKDKREIVGGIMGREREIILCFQSKKYFLNFNMI